MSIEDTHTEEKNEKGMESTEKIVRNVGTYSIHVIAVPGRNYQEKREEMIFREIIIEQFPKLKKHIVVTGLQNQTPGVLGWLS